MNYLFLYLPYLFLFIALYLPTKPWFLPSDQITYLYILSFFIFLQTIVLIFINKNIFKEVRFLKYLPPNWCIAGFYFLFMLWFPIRNRNWGDGLLLLETNLLETKLFGFQFTLDEILESILHSKLTSILSYFQFDEDPILSYSILSYIAGILILSGFLWLGKKKQKDLSILVLLSSGGVLLTFGYAENYTLVTAVHLLFYLFLNRFSQDTKDSDILLYGSTAFVALSMLFHLVSGYLVIYLVYLWIFHSPKEKKLKHLVICTFLGGIILFPWFVYFSVFHDPTVDRNSTHLIHPPFYPIKRWVSTSHIKEIFSVLYWNVSFSSFFLLYQWYFQKEKWNHFIQKPNHKLILVTTFAFILHGFLHNPQLGFPADWDLMGFYWLPITVLAFLYWNSETEVPVEWIPLLLLCVTLVMISAMELSKTNPKDELVWQITKKAITKYSIENQSFIQSLPKEDKKFFAKGDFLFFKGEYITDQLCDFKEKKSLIQSMKDHRKNWREGFLNRTFQSKEKLNIFLTDATKTNVLYLKSLEANKICHPKL
ncbi:dolichyl-phosphate-mannose--protein mannosyltransferase [Leptospira levettii]|uniref:Dolichyl-phosphate-mannose--protein mannosyltransferase n=1 Tax=Leptospira levettii TaxID=2023178 RepID=A0ABY2MLQ3_9LEPT|nr:dolichyl-phosphate-mannose--protein mannosyltransferase [Leptospira levettii]PKA25553.1 dolichyl-phosphate-mannose--protein mannosyltransferase [Leptospira sp. mixed culture ATI2-C-A1]TGL68818.1 dolichyl-phosphate-mannose--protein mannosyltransferase [Leptospira levettii]TGM29064.1 dolichyl-phosphate-mannose--protein mannosyltransferase [Leptospira levettii]